MVECITKEEEDEEEEDLQDYEVPPRQMILHISFDINRYIWMA